MNPMNQRAERPNAHLFNVDLLVESESAAKALERLLRLLNEAGFADYRINSGAELGRLIAALEAQAEPKPIPVPAESGARPPEPSPMGSPVMRRIADSIASNALIRISVNKGAGAKLNMPCRVIKLDEAAQSLTVYHVDEKQVYTFGLNEIDEMN
ncbi:hypothetical protein SAMN02799624_02707 [Paenibacillus sp. UNC496MF]|uniref:hypothetical protein n=1 Tax=Paenibacillus sp. UNC496MF TaxID=1502753 RepID=UPI0008ECE2F7|nr:hypothetical protein [Paenibacillus sp. UNC496MF]SFI92552.1 hypothetical protein SAMN02799624_02707 [Paenibacillus sp. UNC496MF]